MTKFILDNQNCYDSNEKETVIELFTATEYEEAQKKYAEDKEGATEEDD